MLKRSTLEQPFRSALIVLFVSEVAATIGPIIDGIITASFYGTGGVEEFGLVNPLLIAYNVIGSVFAVGSVTLCTRLIGEGKTDDARGAFSVAFLWVTVLSVIVTIVLLLFSDQVVSLLGANPAAAQMYAEAKGYFIGITVSFPAINIMLFLSAYMQVDSDKQRALVSMIVLTVVDIAADLLNVFVIRWGMSGMGAATSIANYAAMVILLLHFAKKGAFFKPRLRRLPWKRTGQMLFSGASACLTLLGNAIAFIILNRILLKYNLGTVIVAFTAARSVITVLFSVCKGMGRCVMTMSGFFYGERSKEDLADLLRLMLKYTILLAGAVTVVSAIAAHGLALLFVGGRDPANVSEAAVAIRWVVLSIPFMTANVGYECFFRGAGRMKQSLSLSFLRDFLLIVLFGFLLSAIFGPRGVYASLFVSQLALFLGTVTLLFVRTRKKDKPLILELLFLPGDFDVPDEDKLRTEITTIAECIALSEKMAVFCKKHGIDERRKLYATLAIEEMCKNILTHGFRKKGKNMITVSTHIGAEKDIHLSIRDNCFPFDPTAWERIHHNDTDPASNIGIRMITGLSTEMRYVNIMDMNCLYLAV